MFATYRAVHSALKNHLNNETATATHSIEFKAAFANGLANKRKKAAADAAACHTKIATAAMALLAPHVVSDQRFDQRDTHEYHHE